MKTIVSICKSSEVNQGQQTLVFSRSVVKYVQFSWKVLLRISLLPLEFQKVLFSIEKRMAIVHPKNEDALRIIIL